MITLQDLNETLANADMSYQELKQSTAAEDEEIEKVEQRLGKLRACIAEDERKGHAAKSAQADFSKEKEQMRRKIMQLTNLMDTAEAGAARVLQDAMLESVELPAASVQQEVEGIPVPECFCFDFSQLPERMKNAPSETRQQNLDLLREELEQLRHEIDGMAPNLKAPDEYEAILQEENALKKVKSPSAFILVHKNHVSRSVYVCRKWMLRSMTKMKLRSSFLKLKNNELRRLMRHLIMYHKRSRVCMRN